MLNSEPTRISNPIAAKLFRYGFVLLAVLLVGGYELFNKTPPELSNEIGWVLFRLFVAGLSVYALTIWVFGLFNMRRLLENRLSEAEARLWKLQNWQEIAFRLSRNLVEATDEYEMIDQVLHLTIDAANAHGASFVPFDDRGQPIAAISRGALPPMLMDPIAEHLATRQVIERCLTCEKLQASDGENCPALSGPISQEFPEIQHVHCMILKCGDRKVGAITLYLPGMQPLEPELDVFLRNVADELALGLESIRLRKKEIATLQQLQSVRQKTDLHGMLVGLLEQVQTMVEADYSVLFLQDPENKDLRLRVARGKSTPQILSFSQGILQGVAVSAESVMMGEVFGTDAGEIGVKSILAAPLLTQEGRSLGAILLGNTRRQPFTRRQLSLLKSIAGHVALLVNNASVMSDLEYKTMLDERHRLAREIHDGLAQTLGFLKLQVAQLQNILRRGETDRLEKGLQLSYETLSEAYLEVRDAIDGLRIDPAEEGILTWIQDLLAEFEDATDLKSSIEGGELLANAPAEVRVQLIRIIQEALSNIRKHAYARMVRVFIEMVENEMVIQIIDDGRGFSPEDVSSEAQFGLRGMRERAELIGADFQVTSKTLEGTSVRVGILLPMGQTYE